MTHQRPENGGGAFAAPKRQPVSRRSDGGIFKTGEAENPRVIALIERFPAHRSGPSCATFEAGSGSRGIRNVKVHSARLNAVRKNLLAA